MKFNINSPASCRTSRGRTAKPGGTQEKGPASNSRATPGLQLPGQTRHHSRASAAKYFYSNWFCVYRSAEKWHPDDQGRKLLPIKMWLLDWFVFFHSPLVCRAGWTNDQFILVNVPFLFCLLPLQDKLLLGSQEFPESQKDALFCGFLDKPLAVTPLWHAGLHGWLQTCFWNNMLKANPKVSMAMSVSLDTGTTAAGTGSEPDSILNK